MKVSGVFRVTAVKKKTRARMFEDMNEGDEFIVSVPIKNHRYHYHDVRVTFGIHLRTLSLKELANIMANFDVENVV